MIAQMRCAKLLCQKAILARDIYYDRVKHLGNDMTFLGDLDKATIHEEPKRHMSIDFCMRCGLSRNKRVST